MSNCINGSLSPYTPSDDSPWTRRRVQHLYNRLGNGADLTEIDAGHAMTPDALVTLLLNNAEAAPIPETDTFSWAYSPYFTSEDSYDRAVRYGQLKRDFAAQQARNPVRYKLASFWHSHFATESFNDGPLATFIYLYYRLLVNEAFGNFKDFTQKMGLNPLMLRYLNGSLNRVGQANENYARELMELFTLGEGNYTQDDVENVAKGLTGWKVLASVYDLANGNFIINPDDRTFNKTHHDWSTLTLFGESYQQAEQPEDDEEAEEAAYETYQWIHDTIFEEKKDILAKFICTKLYKFYVYHEPNEEIINGMATTFIANNWEIRPVLSELFKSEHFFDVDAIGTQVMSPLQLYSGYVKKTGYIYNEHWFMTKGALHDGYDPNNPFDTASSDDLNRDVSINLFSFAGGGGQVLFLPPSVAGWTGNRAWINEIRLVTRWEFMYRLIRWDFSYPPSVPEDDPISVLYKNFLIEVSGNSSDAAVVTQAVIDHYIIVPLDEEHFNEALDIFKGNIDPQYFENGYWNLEFPQVPTQFYWLINYLFKLPEFHLC